MATEYIRRADIINNFQIWRTDLTQQIEENIEFPHTRSDLKVCRTQLDDCIDAIREIPAADVRPVVRGKWIRVDYEPCGHDYICSECGCKSDGAWNFCHDCGADMRKVVEIDQVKEAEE